CRLPPTHTHAHTHTHTHKHKTRCAGKQMPLCPFRDPREKMCTFRREVGQVKVCGTFRPGVCVCVWVCVCVMCVCVCVLVCVCVCVSVCVMGVCVWLVDDCCL